MDQVRAEIANIRSRGAAPNARGRPANTDTQQLQGIVRGLGGALLDHLLRLGVDDAIELHHRGYRVSITFEPMDER